MRPAVVLFAALLISTTLSAQSSSTPLSTAPAEAGLFPCQQHSERAGDRLGFDPYNPSHLAIIRSYGGALLAQAPLAALLRLDPFVPTEAALLRQLGAGIPLWTYTTVGWVPPAAPIPCAPTSRAPQSASGIRTDAPFAPRFTTFQEMFASLPERTSPTADTAREVAISRTAIGRGNEPARGITIQHDGRLWSSAGPAIRFEETEFVRVGERAGVPIYTRDTRAQRQPTTRPGAPADGRQAVPAGAQTGAPRQSRAGDADRLIYVPTVPGLVAPFRVVP